MEHIYVDHAATSPMHPKVIEKMVSIMNEDFGNPSSIHSFGRSARQIIDVARAAMADSIGAHPNDIIFTSGGTEADNHAIFGVAESYKTKGNHIITTQIEHHAVLHACEQLEKQGYEVTYLPVDKNGRVSVPDIKAALRDDTILVTIMYGNNEVGTLQPISEIGQALANHQAIFHTDAVQAYGLVKIDVKDAGIDLLSVSAHKINGPKGIGYLYVDKDVKLPSRLYGGQQERKRRAGTENVAAIAGFLEAVNIAQKEMDNKKEFFNQLRSVLMETLDDYKINYSQNGSLDETLPHVLNLSFPGTNVEAMLVNLDLAGIAASSGSACTAGSIDPSHVLVAMYGKDDERLLNSIRFSFGLNNTVEQIKQVGKETSKIVQRFTNK
ncbi:cysteine desulfurase [Cytobacillus horneckiae]|uniref:cysteine desulfurase n=1 Tax=Cytobacillus horneckiae TaxID=549687 RepID=A0A2N0ZI74_9BACI|nr:cysteine desulfurase family protein [Cytobacillus horneckiae]MBN6887807.1 cysteine desulfurase [Cytobacillus horneckiae]MCM3179837.1 cysteine desulfurase [Cytobacillus horneckiae]MEC1155225.1 cysteine desulfurase family protein [Cytobacillus horneckiae]PKG29210.1 cysteine desulfurase [Cytobacillus horneckiae]